MIKQIDMTPENIEESIAKMKAKAEEFRNMFVNAPKPAPKVTMTYESAKALVAELRKKNENKTL